MTKITDIPAIRFKGFSDTWEQRKVSELFKVTRGYVLAATLTEPAKTDEMPYPVYSSQTKDNGLMGYYKDYLYEDAITWTTDGANAGTVNYRAGKFYCTNVCGVLLSNEVTANQMIAEALNNVAKGYVSYVGNPKLMNNVMADIEIMIPTHAEEREKLSVFFRNLDNLITLHQRKYDKLTNVKKSMLEKMFPQNGSNVPEIRFKGFTEAWEQRKVTEIGKIYIGLVTTMTKHYTDEGTLLIRNSDIKDGKFEFGDNPIYLEKTFAEKNETRMHQIGDVITVHTGDVGTSAVITENEAKSIGFATIVTRPNPKIIDSNYLCSFLNTDKHKKWAVSISTGDGRTNYNLGDYFELVVPVPSIAEQKKIASYIQKLNRLITLHQRKPVVVNSSSTMNALPNQHLYFQVLE